MKLVFRTFLAVIAMALFTGCDSFILDGSRWIFIEEDGNSIRYLEFKNGTVRQYEHDLVLDCHIWQDPAFYTETEADDDEKEGTITIIDGTIIVDGVALSEIRFRISGKTLILAPADSELDLDDVDEETEGVQIFDEGDFNPVRFRPQCADLVDPNPTPSPTPSPTVTPTPSPSPSPTPVPIGS